MSDQHDRDSAELRKLCRERDDARSERDNLKAINAELLDALQALLEAIGGNDSTDIWCVNARAAIAKTFGQLWANARPVRAWLAVKKFIKN